MTRSTATVTARAGEVDEVAAGRSHLVALFAVYLGLLAWAVLWKLEVPWVGEAGERIIKLVPFVATARAGASTPFDVVVNLLLFVPFGLYLGLLAPSVRWWKAAATVAAASLTFEVTQYVLAVGSSDLTDVLVNTAGGVLGFGLLVLARRRLGAGTGAVMGRICAIATVVALVAGAVVVASPLSFGTPQDVRCDPTHPGQCRVPGRPGGGD